MENTDQIWVYIYICMCMFASQEKRVVSSQGLRKSFSNGGIYFSIALSSISYMAI